MKKLPIFCLFLAILLNSIVLASPLKPAIVGSDVIVAPRLVAPFTRWERRLRFIVGEEVIGFADADSGGVWVIYLTYSIRHVDLLTSAGEWRVWMLSRLQSYLNNVYNISGQGLPAGAEREDHIRLYVEMVSEPVIQEQLCSGLKSQFNEHYQGVLVMQGVTIMVEEITIAEYQARRD